MLHGHIKSLDLDETASRSYDIRNGKLMILRIIIIIIILFAYYLLFINSKY